MTALRVLVVDDEPLAIDRMEVLLSRIDGVEVIATANSGEAAVTLAERLAPDLCLLDIGMPQMDGVIAARTLASLQRAPHVVFVTAFNEFAVAAFEVDAVDYLLKPVQPHRLREAIERVRRQADGARSHPATHGFLSEFWASDRQGLTRIATDQIDRITAERDYMRLHVGVRSWLINDSLTRLEEQLDPTAFVRLHRGAIVRRNFINGFRYDGSWVARLADGTEQKVGRAYAERARTMAKRCRLEMG